MVSTRVLKIIGESSLDNSVRQMVSSLNAGKIKSSDLMDWCGTQGVKIDDNSYAVGTLYVSVLPNFSEYEDGVAWLQGLDLRAKRHIAEILGIKYDPNRRFWEHPEPLYHATSSANYESILVHGINVNSRSRGVSNRHVGSAVFTSTNVNDVRFYGEIVFEIDTEGMKKDGYMPKVGKEPDAECYELGSAIAHRLGWRGYWQYSEDGMSHDTVIVYGDVPSKYIHIL